MKRPIVAILTLVAALSAYGQQTAPTPPDKPVDKPVEQTKKNIKVLTGLPSSQLIPVMAFMSNSLGVACTHCHVNKVWESDEKPQKDVARQHIALTRSINEQHFGKTTAVTCNTCHNGQARPSATPLVANAGWNKAAAAPPVPLRPAAEILKQYVAAIGGETAFNVKNRLSRGTVTRSSGREPDVSQPFTLFQAPPSVELKTELSYPPEADRMLTRFFVIAPKLPGAYSSFATVGRETIRGRSAWVVEATPSQGPTDRLYFDAETGLMLRQAKQTVTPFGVLPEEYDFDDWRAAGNAKLPFRIEWRRADYHVTHQFEETRTNVER